MKKRIKLDSAAARDAFRELSRKCQSELENGILKACLIVERAAKTRFSGRGSMSYPNSAPRVDTGRLRASITHRILSKGNGVQGQIGSNVEYAKYVEFGTSRTYPHPFLRWAIKMKRKQVIDTIVNGIKRELKS